MTSIFDFIQYILKSRIGDLLPFRMLSKGRLIWSCHSIVILLLFIDKAVFEQMKKQLGDKTTFLSNWGAKNVNVNQNVILLYVEKQCRKTDSHNSPIQKFQGYIRALPPPQWVCSNFFFPIVPKQFPIF